MITEIRQKLQGSGFKIVVWVILIAFALSFSPYLFKGSGARPNAAATVNGTQIAIQEYQRRVYQETERIDMLRQQLGAYADSLLKSLGMNNPRKMALQALIQEELITQIANKLGITVSADYIASKLYDAEYIVQELGDLIPLYALDQQGNINMSLLQKHLERYGITMQEFEHKLEEKIRRSLVMEIVGLATYPTEQTIQSRFADMFLGKKYTIITLAFDKILNNIKSAGVNSKELADFFANENRKNHRYWVPEKRQAAIWTFNPEQYGLDISDQEIKAYYDNHKTSFIKTPAQMKVRHILFELPEGANPQEIQTKAQEIRNELVQNPSLFEQLANKHNPSTIKKGGLIDFFSKGEKDQAFERAAFRLQKDGDISDVVTTADGFEIIQRVERKATSYKPLESVKKEIVKRVQETQFKQLFSHDMTRLIESIKKNPTALNDSIQKKNGIKKEVEKSRNDDSPLAQKIFKLKEGDWVPMIEDGKGLLINVTSIQKSYEPTLDTVKNQVEQDWYRAKAEQQQREMAPSLLKAIHEHTDARGLEKKFAFTQETTSWIKNSDKEQLEKLSKKGIPVSELISLEKVGQSEIIERDGQLFILKLDAIEPFDEQLYNEHRQKIEAAAYQEEKALTQRAFVASLYRNATIKTTELIQANSEDSLS